MSVDQNKAAVRRAIEILDSLDANTLEEVFSPELAAGLPRGDEHAAFQ
jgi:hypothetical protein